MNQKHPVKVPIPVIDTLLRTVMRFSQEHDGMPPSLILMHPLLLEYLKTGHINDSSIRVEANGRVRFMEIPIYGSVDIDLDDIVV